MRKGKNGISLGNERNHLDKEHDSTLIDSDTSPV